MIFSERDSVAKVVRIGSCEYEPSAIVQQVMMSTKVQKGSKTLETAEETQKLNEQKKRWLEDIDDVESLLKLLAKPGNHKTASNIK